MSFDDDLDAELASETEYRDVDVLVNGNLQTLRFTQMDSLQWADLCDKCPPRPTAPLDRSYGYNLRAVVPLAVPTCGQLRDGDDWINLSDEQWTKLLRGKGAGLRLIGDALFDLNEWSPGAAVVAAKKASAAESVKNSSSPAPSESPEAD